MIAFLNEFVSSSTQEGTKQDLPWWVWLLIAVLSLIALGLGFWGLLGAGTSRKNDYQKNKETKNIKLNTLIKKESISIKDLEKHSEQIEGIYAIFIGNSLNIKEYFLPIYFGYSNDVIKTFKDFSNKLIEQSDDEIVKKIKDYIIDQELTIDQIKFIIVEKNNKENLDQYISEYNSQKRGFN
ncbi:hypothetical protein [Mesoplasma photuris]|uniref:hypothetical protein n=1 Tax=Mesoplasma photuris TaxID=217731 RepID=UPI0004E15F9B|nr:hypothetical protein [Mesoplasma photuris]